ncbi:MAG: leucyl aminopeptidase [Bacillota bacterium]
MRIDVLQGSLTQVSSDALVVNLFEGVTRPGGATGAVDAALDGAVSGAIARGEFGGKLGEVGVIPTGGRLAARWVLLAGLGKRDRFSLREIRRVASEVQKEAIRLKLSNVASIVHGAGIGGMDPSEAAQAMVIGTLVRAHRPVSYRSRGESDQVLEFTLVEPEANKIEAVTAGARRGQVLAGAINLARDLVTMPGNKLYPETLAEAARSAIELGLRVDVLDEKDLTRIGAEALLAVGQGSQRPPRLIVLNYEGPGAEDKPLLALVGKGLTFDSGGISLKDREGMAAMKFDMAGGAAVLAAVRAIGQLRLPVRVVGIIPAAENLPSGTALKPGDVIGSLDGQTIEIISTDAEGRLILADGVAYARRLGAAHIVDLATLTGACSIALGDQAFAVVSTDDQLRTRILEAADRGLERAWPLPVYPEYREQVKSDIADLRNSGGRGAGTITGGLFVGSFAGDVPWAHLDIASTAWASEDKAGQPKGATGVGVTTLIELAALLGR